MKIMKKIQFVALKVKDLAMNSRWNEIKLTSQTKFYEIIFVGQNSEGIVVFLPL
jgi:hypothetical protein